MKMIIFALIKRNPIAGSKTFRRINHFNYGEFAIIKQSNLNDFKVILYSIRVEDYSD